ncbi:hypothetical protein PHMEG_00021778 [Phytophthora megakarya]|uniref:Uncharacterized protein n=1 Tax=Phytophthora megakarya TaxID=4795 RepID=A0A225VKE6_9STRA|nr:hypothetical protein PHMEG_00021778 [Phytophthora megakarya]
MGWVPPQLQQHVDQTVWVPHWRLTHPHRDLFDELEQRPLLSVFRFVRVSMFYVATSRDDTKFVWQTSDISLCGQVVSYDKASSIDLVDEIDLIMETNSSYICRVATRHYAYEICQVMAIHLEVRVNHISQDENMVGH